MPPVERRTADRDRRRWNDQALDRLADQVDTLENEREVVAVLPERVRGLKDAIDQLRTAQRDAADLEVRRVDGIHQEIRELRELVNDRFNKVDSDHSDVRKLNRAALERSFWDKLKDTLAVLIPIIVALIMAWATISAATGNHP